MIARNREQEGQSTMDHRKYNPDRFTRQSLRLPERGYTTTSAYFITLRADQPEPIFEIPKIRQLLLETWQALPKRFPWVTLDEFVIMPDHVHFILWLDSSQKDSPTLGRVIGAYKSIVAIAWLDHIKTNNLQCSGRIWQRNYYERIVRMSELEKTRAYIRNNPVAAKGDLATARVATTFREGINRI